MYRCFYVLFLHMFRKDNRHISAFERKLLTVFFFSDTIKTSSFKLCMIINLLGVYIVIMGLMTLALFHRYAKNVNCELPVLDSCPL